VLVRGFYDGKIINCYSNAGTQATRITDEQVASGELCYLLNGDQSEIIWYQTLGEDRFPVFDPTHSVVMKNEDGTFGNATGIAPGLSPEEERPATVYDLSGRQMVNGTREALGSSKKLQKGIYIIKGKKVFVK